MELCGYSWSFKVGKVTIHHRCGEVKGHKGSHVCTWCGQTA